MDTDRRRADCCCRRLEPLAPTVHYDFYSYWRLTNNPLIVRIATLDWKSNNSTWKRKIIHMRQLSLWMAWHKTPTAVDSTVSSTSRVRLQILIRPPPQSVSLETKKEEKKKVGEGSVSLTFIMIKEKPVYPYNTLSLKHRVPPHHRRPFFLQPISHREPHLHRVQPQRGGARG